MKTFLNKKLVISFTGASNAVAAEIYYLKFNTSNYVETKKISINTGKKSNC